MTATYKRFEVLVVSFPFSSHLKEKARPVVVISNDVFNQTKRQDLIVVAISGSHINKLPFESEIQFWKEAGLIKPSILKAAIATIEQSSIIQKLGMLQLQDQKRLDGLLEKIVR